MTSVAGSGLQISAQAAENTAPWAPSSENVKYSAHRPRRLTGLWGTQRMEGRVEMPTLCDLGDGL